MKKFKYRALDQNGQEVISTAEAYNEAQAFNIVRSKGLYPTYISEDNGVIEAELVESTPIVKIPWRDFFLVLLGFLLHWFITAIL